MRRLLLGTGIGGSSQGPSPRFIAGPRPPRWTGSVETAQGAGGWAVPNSSEPTHCRREQPRGGRALPLCPPQRHRPLRSSLIVRPLHTITPKACIGDRAALPSSEPTRSCCGTPADRTLIAANITGTWLEETPTGVAGATDTLVAS